MDAVEKFSEPTNGLSLAVPASTTMTLAWMYNADEVSGYRWTPTPAATSVEKLRTAGTVVRHCDLDAHPEPGRGYQSGDDRRVFHLFVLDRQAVPSRTDQGRECRLRAGAPRHIRPRRRWFVLVASEVRVEDRMYDVTYRNAVAPKPRRDHD